ncbi:MAG TPA: ATP-binding protein [Bacteroidia bacterium]|jgi:predicted ATP-dependent endonuclease of OLD family|nr:ATP-binding protein [Bacteroidia bacterium]HMU20240.1 ATP-binding protein [Bacteroidia bacterium]
MKIKSVKIKNFRSYKEEVKIDIGDLTAFVGKNDIGKSSILEVLDIFFNEGKGVIKIDKDDVNKSTLADGDDEIEITVEFEELPTSLVIDSTNATTLQNEHLLNQDGNLEIIKKYPNAGKEKVFVKAFHPNNSQCRDLLKKTNAELRTIIGNGSIECENRTINAVMRTAIWNHYHDSLQLEDIEIDVTKGDTKSIWEKLQEYLPLYSLFQSDRKNSDGDSEVQDPLQEAVKQILNNAEPRTLLSRVATEVETKLREVADSTLAKLNELNPDIADSLNPIIPSSDNLKWIDVFKKVSIAGDEAIPINKRGSGIKRLILLSFFRAEAERRRTERNSPSIVYAIEEPETSQHTEHQKKLMAALLTLSQAANTQILLTTHSAVAVKELKFEHIRLVAQTATTKTVEEVIPNQLPYPSLNEVNFLAFNEVTEEYHNELYGFIEAEGWLTNFINGKPTMNYIRMRNGNPITEQKVLTEYIRHQIHHPENTSNTRFTHNQLSDSIILMRDFIEA